jgi:Concanavalin A-like lectin/glucanases superfamily/Glycoside hydrolase 123 N-terminal domain
MYKHKITKGKSMLMHGRQLIAKVIICLVFALAGHLCQAEEYTPDEHTLFLAHYNKTLNADYAKGSPEGSVATSRTQGLMKLTYNAGGKFGEGLITGAHDDALSLSYDAKGNIDPGVGTIELWVKPNWDGDEISELRHYLFEAHGDKWNQNTIFLMAFQGQLIFTLYDDTAGAHTLSADITQWKKGEWHHIAATWDSIEKNMLLYVDGKVQDGFDDKFFSLKTPHVLTFGYFSQRNHWADAVIDEVRISNIVRTDISRRIDKNQAYLKPQVPSAAYNFNFGTPSSPNIPGFKKVTKSTLYDVSTGYGFVGENLPEDNTDEKGPDDLSRSYVQGSATFKVDLPAGDYEIWILQAQRAWYHGPSAYFMCWINGEKKIDIDFKVGKRFSLPWDKPGYENLYFKNFNNDYYPGQNIFDKYVKKIFVPITVTAQVKDQPLEIKFDGYMRGMIIYPAAAKEQATAEISELEKYRKSTMPFIEIKADEPPVDAPFTKADKNRGYVVFKKHWMKEVYPHTVPLKNERHPKILSTFATLGEYEPLTFSIHPLQELGEVKVSVSDLKDEFGNVLDSDQIDIRYMRYIETRYAMSQVPDPYAVKNRRFTGTGGGGPRYYHIVPRILKPLEQLSMGKDVNRTFWLTVKVPANAKGGLYKGKIKVQPEKGKQSTIDIEVNALPFALQKPPRDYGMFFFGCDRRWDMMEKELVDMREHGMTMTGMPVFSPAWEEVEVVDGKVKADFSEISKFMKLYERVGFSGPAAIIYHLFPSNVKMVDHTPDIYDTQSIDIYLQLLDKTWKMAKAQNWPEIILWSSDEIASKEDEYHHAVEFFKLLKKSKVVKENNITVMNTENHRRGMGFVGLVDIMLPNLFVGINEKNIQKFRESTTKLGFYNMGYDRYVWGFYCTKVDVCMYVHWHYQTLAGDFYDPFDFFYKEGHLTVFPSPDGPIPTNLWEEIREGVDDAKYIFTLKSLITEAEKSSDSLRVKKAKAARAVLEGIMGKVEVDFNYYWEKPNLWKEQCDSYRWQIAQQIMNIATEVKN